MKGGRKRGGGMWWDGGELCIRLDICFPDPNSTVCHIVNDWACWLTNNYLPQPKNIVFINFQAPLCCSFPCWLSCILHVDFCLSSLEHQRVSWTKQFTGLEPSTDLQSIRTASDDLTLTGGVSVVSNYNKSTLNHVSLNRYILSSPSSDNRCTLSPYSAPGFFPSKFHPLISEIPCHVIQTSAQIFQQVIACY